MDIFVLHVAKGYEERRRHIDSMMGRLGLSFEYILDGDIDSLSPEIMSALVAPGSMLEGKPAAISCSYKHLLAYRQIIARELPGAVVLEDDIILSDSFADIAQKAVAQLPDDAPAIISFEDTRLRFVPRSRRRKGQIIYPGSCDRFAGAYYINAAAAVAINKEVSSCGFDLPVDLLHNRLRAEGKLNYWWTHPCPASQGSFSGLFISSLSAADRSKAFIWKLQRLYKRSLYFFR